MTTKPAYPPALIAIVRKLIESDYVSLEPERDDRVRLVIDSSVYLTNEEADWFDGLLDAAEAKA